MTRTGTFSKSSKFSLRTELCAGLVLLCIAMPLNVGVALASGVAPESGIISGVVASLVTGVLSGSSMLISGPDAGIGVLVLEIVQKHGPGNLGAIVFACGLMQLAIGLLNASKWFKAVSPAVVNGMLAGMGLLIIFTQLHIMVDDVPKESGLMNMLLLPETLMKGLFPPEESSHHIAALLGVATIFVAISWARLAPSRLKTIPNVLVAILASSTLAFMLNLNINVVCLPRSLTENIKVLSLESFMTSLSSPDLIVSAAMLAFVCSAQSLVTLTAIESSTFGKKGVHNRELVAQGIGNLICGTIGALPIVGVLLRSMANVQNGATTKLPNLLHGVLMVLAILLLPTLLQLIPTCVLASTLVLIGFRMVSSIGKTVRGYERDELVIFAITACAIVVTNLFTGVLIGFVAAALKQLYALAHLDLWLHRSRNSDHIVLHMRGAATFLQLPRLVKILEDVPEGVVLHLRLDEVSYIDHACLQALVQWERKHRDRLLIDWEMYSLRAGLRAKRLGSKSETFASNSV